MMNPVLAEMLRERRVATPEGERVPLHSELPAAEGGLLQHWLARHSPRRLLEIGLAYGVSSHYICDALAESPPDCYHIIDAFQSEQWQGAGIHGLRRAGYGERITLIEQRSELCLPELLGRGNRYDFAFIDGWHTFDHALVEFFYINRMLDVGGIVIFDDVHLPGLRKLLAYIATYPCYRPLQLPDAVAGTTQARVRRLMSLPPARLAGFEKIDEDRRDWDFFEDFQ